MHPGVFIRFIPRIVPFFFLLLILPASGAQTVPLSLLTGWNSIQQADIRSDLAYLTSRQMEGRLALTRGDERAIQWLANAFRQSGLQPANGNSYLQTFNVIEYIPDRKQSFVAMERAGRKVMWKKPDVYTDFNRDINLESGVVFAGYGITAPELKYDDYAGLDVKGKLVMVFEHEPQETNPASIFNGLGNTPYATTRVKALNAQKHGAIGILIVPEPNRKHPSNQERYLRIGGSASRKLPLPSMTLENDELQIPVAVLSDKAARIIAGPLSLSGLQSDIDRDLVPRSRVIANTRISMQERVSSRRIAATSNVAALLEGTDPVLKSETIIVSAHHDHDGRSAGKIWHGADDNASGTAGVLALARAFAVNDAARTGMKPKRSILFVIFAAEERGLLGSYYMASHPLRPLETTRAMINFDMIGRDEQPSSQTKGLIAIPKDTRNRLNLIGAHFSPDYDRIVRQENQVVGLVIDDRFDSENALNTFFRSDQFPFVLNDVPAFWWFTGFHPDYHHTSDTADKIDYPKMQKILRLAYLSAYQFANMSKPPKFIRHPHA
ncbi:Leupeptin-inactivating enzyme 1 [Aquicella siphonis]|uniref:Leupeptin-inactivating enzyme 1 n=1 Tax=Aquicella siphonis TaxID=254247 RepID=A0A5E4PFE5_9COXI|nr:M28 family peptidase [Aquicella siphonis]VVC75564.1 Leupeptin-inactivating enzyme 1 [Aquicella siphonis]